MPALNLAMLASVDEGEEGFSCRLLCGCMCMRFLIEAEVFEI